MHTYEMTQEGYNKLNKELDHLIIVGRKEVAAMLKEAVSFGDLSENSEYEIARNRQNEIESRIRVLQDRLSNTRVVSEDNISKDKVSIGSTVQVLDELGEEVTYKIVGDGEGDPMEYKISSSSMVGKALIGNHVGDKVDIALPGGNIQYEIMNIL